MNSMSQSQPIAKSTSLNSYQSILYDRALHPELFELQARSVVQGEGYELEAWVIPGQHVLRFECGMVCCSEVVTDNDQHLPEQNRVQALFCAGEHDVEHEFEEQPVRYMTSVQTEQLGENIYDATLREMLDHAASADEHALVHRWVDAFGENLSLIDIQRYAGEVHAQAYHLLARGGVVIRTQTLFEQG